MLLKLKLKVDAAKVAPWLSGEAERKPGFNLAGPGASVSLVHPTCK